MNPTISIDSVMGLRPYYSRDHVTSMFGGRTECTLLEVLNDPGVKDADKVWLACHVLEPDVRQALANLWAERAIRRAYPTAPAKWQFSWADTWLSGEDRSASSAWAAVTTAGETMAAVRAAEAAAWADYVPKVEEAAAFAAYAAAAETDRRQQVQDIIELLTT
jgi:hypothetical protein